MIADFGWGSTDGDAAKQIRAARGLLGWSQTDLGLAAGMSRSTINDLENETGNPRPSALVAVRKALEAAGVEFTNGKAPGVRLRKGQ